MRKNKKEIINGFVKSLMNEIELPYEYGFNLDINSNNLLNINGCKEIKLYTENEIIIDCQNLTVVISGNGLLIKSCEKFRLSITGYINSIQFIKT